jgi:fatty acid desaturase
MSTSQNSEPIARSSTQTNDQLSDPVEMQIAKLKPWIRRLLLAAVLFIFSGYMATLFVNYHIPSKQPTWNSNNENVFGVIVAFFFVIVVLAFACVWAIITNIILPLLVLYVVWKGINLIMADINSQQINRDRPVATSSEFPMQDNN